jgi:amino-acid N-acetyltransferase
MAFGKGKIRTRKALLPDAPAIHALIAHYADRNVLLPRTIGEICENVRDFTVVEQNGRVVERPQYGVVIVGEGDVLELVRFVGGG